MLKRWVVRAPTGTMRYCVTQAVVVSRLAVHRRMRLKMLLLGIAIPLRDKWLGPRDARLRLRYGRLEVPWTVRSLADYAALNEVLLFGVYGVRLPETAPSTILDLGGHMGASVLFWRERFPEARIVTVEPNPVTFRRLQQNVGALPGVELLNVAVAKDDGPVPFFPNAQHDLGSSLWGDGESVLVEGRGFRSLIAEIGGVDLLKVDIEGAERYILDDLALQTVGAIVGEYHDPRDGKESERFFAPLREQFDLSTRPTTSPSRIMFWGLRSRKVSPAPAFIDADDGQDAS